MITTLELLAAVKQAAGNCSDYRVAQILDIQKATVSKWARGVGGMSEETARKAAHYLELQEDWVVACIHAEKHQGTEMYEVWQQICNKLQSEQNAA